jgi:hypothetical protein
MELNFELSELPLCLRLGLRCGGINLPSEPSLYLRQAFIPRAAELSSNLKA